MAPIPHLIYVVDRHETHWTVGLGCGDCVGRFPSRRDALRSALTDAERVRRLGCEVEVVVRRRDGTVRKIAEHLRFRTPDDGQIRSN